MAPGTLKRGAVRRRRATSGPDLGLRDASEGKEKRHVRKAADTGTFSPLATVLREALVRARGMKAAFVYGSAATGQDTPQNAIELMVISDASYGDCFGGLLSAERLLKCQI